MELLVVVGTIAVVASIAVAFISNANSSLTDSKLKQDVARLNTSIEMFLGSGGSLSGIDTAQGVITELKRAAANEMSVVGLRGSTVDIRLQAIDEVAADQRERAIWNAQLAKFTIAESDTGVREFVLNEELARVDYTDVTRNTPLVYNATGGWVWLTRDFDLAANLGPATIPTTVVPSLNGAGGAGSANGAQLNPPIISPGSGSLPMGEFPLQVTITPHPSDPQGVRLYYSMEPNSWTLYTGPFPVNVGAHVQAYAVHEDPEWGESDRAGAHYINRAEALALSVNVPKNPITYAEAGGALEEGDYTPPAPLAPITVALDSASNFPEELLDSSHFQVYWSLRRQRSAQLPDTKRRQRVLWGI